MTEETTEVPVPTAKKNKKEREKEKVEKEKLKAETVDLKSPDPSQDRTEGLDKMTVSEPIPYIWLSIQHNWHLSGFEIISSMKLPSPEEVYTYA